MILGKGLPNLGNTCYLNSILQCLRYSKPFVFLLKEYDGRKETPMMRNFIDLLYAGASKTSLNIFVHSLAVNSSEFKLLRQCDAHEFYLYVVDTLYRKGFKYKNVFKGCCQSTVTCSICNNKSITITPFISLSLQMITNESASVETLLNNYCEVESLVDKIDCDSCGIKTDSTRQINISETPSMLVIHLKRFKAFVKDTTPVKINQSLTINGTQYILNSICNHSGGVGSGHYTAACRKRDGTWIMCNDDFLTELSRLPTESPAPYILFYRIKDKQNT